MKYLAVILIAVVGVRAVSASSACGIDLSSVGALTQLGSQALGAFGLGSTAAKAGAAAMVVLVEKIVITFYSSIFSAKSIPFAPLFSKLVALKACTIESALVVAAGLLKVKLSLFTNLLPLFYKKFPVPGSVIAKKLQSKVGSSKTCSFSVLLQTLLEHFRPTYISHFADAYSQ